MDGELYSVDLETSQELDEWLESMLDSTLEVEHVTGESWEEVLEDALSD